MDLLPTDMWSLIFVQCDALAQRLFKHTCKEFHEAAFTQKTRALSSLLSLIDTGQPRQWAYNSYRFVPDGLKHRPQCYDSERSLIARIKYILLRGVYRVTFNVFISICSTRELCDKRKGDILFDELRFLDKDPDDVAYISCNGDKCRRSVNLRDHNIWCDSCHGDMDVSSVFEHFVGSVSWADLPNDDMLCLRARVEELEPDDPDVIAQRNAREDEMARLRRDLAPGGTYEQLIARARERLRELESGEDV